MRTFLLQVACKVSCFGLGRTYVIMTHSLKGKSGQDIETARLVAIVLRRRGRIRHVFSFSLSLSLCCCRCHGVVLQLCMQYESHTHSLRGEIIIARVKRLLNASSPISHPPADRKLLDFTRLIRDPCDFCFREKRRRPSYAYADSSFSWRVGARPSVPERVLALPGPAQDFD